MRLTNTTGLPAPLVRAMERDNYHQPGHISVTGLIQPPRLRQLSIRHDDEIVEDVTQRLWLLMGSAVHAVLEWAEDYRAPELIEQRLVANVAGWIITGKPDLWSAPATLDDYKFTSVYAVKGGVKPEWESQLNIYKMLYRMYGFKVEQLRIIAIYRDWSKSQASRDKTYPQAGAVVVPVQNWPGGGAMAYALERVLLHQAAEALPDDELPPCTPEERWARPTKWAVVKKGNKRATKLHDTEEAAQDHAGELGKQFVVEHRPGGFARCENYCPVTKWCNQYQSELKPEPSPAKGKGKQGDLGV